jgi:hypothetical protein
MTGLTVLLTDLTAKRLEPKAPARRVTFHTLRHTFA